MAGEQSANADDYSCGGGGDDCTCGGASWEFAIALLPDPFYSHRTENRISVKGFPFFTQCKANNEVKHIFIDYLQISIGPGRTCFVNYL